MSIGERLKEVRYALQKTNRISNQSDMANLLGISQPAYSKLERGGASPSKETIEKLSELEVNLNWLFTGEGNMFITNSNNLVTKDNKEFILDEQEEFKYKLIKTMLAAVGIKNFRITHNESIDNFDVVVLSSDSEKVIFNLQNEVDELKEQVKLLMKNQKKLNSQNQ